MIICIVGPTGVGKTKLSIKLAKKYNGIIINGDACQIYKGLDIGSAKIKKDETMGIKHYLIDIKEPNEEYNVSFYQKDLRELLTKYQNKNIIIVGGTGLYLTAGLYDYEFSQHNNYDFSKYTNEELYKMVKEVNSNTDIHPNNRRRLESFLNRVDDSSKEPKLLYNVRFIGLTTDRDTLYTRINTRVDKMIEEGLVKEVEALYKRYGKTSILNRAIGYKEIIKYLDKEISLEDAIDLIKKNSRHYAKRQYTWFNNKMNITWFNTDFDNFDNTYEDVVKYIEKNIVK